MSSLQSAMLPFFNIGVPESHLPFYFDIDSTSVGSRQERNKRNQRRNWYIEQAFKAGLRLSYRSTGHSLSPIISSGMRCHYVPVAANTQLSVQDILLCVVQDLRTLQPNHFAHKIWQIVVLPSFRGTRYMIANAKGYCNGWVDRQN